MKHLNKSRFFQQSILILGIVCSCSFLAQAQTAAKPAAEPAAAPAGRGAASIIDNFFKKYKEDGTGPAVDYLFGTNKYFTNAAAISQLKSKLDSLRQSVGTYLGKELISQKSATPSLVFYSILVKNEIQPLRFTFMFYKPKNDWVLYRFKYDDQMDNELDEAGRINNKKTP